MYLSACLCDILPAQLTPLCSHSTPQVGSRVFPQAALTLTIRLLLRKGISPAPPSLTILRKTNHQCFQFSSPISCFRPPPHQPVQLCSRALQQFHMFLYLIGLGAQSLECRLPGRTLRGAVTACIAWQGALCHHLQSAMWWRAGE